LKSSCKILSFHSLIFSVCAICNSRTLSAYTFIPFNLPLSLSRLFDSIVTAFMPSGSFYAMILSNRLSLFARSIVKVFCSLVSILIRLVKSASFRLRDMGYCGSCTTTERAWSLSYSCYRFLLIFCMFYWWCSSRMRVLWCGETISLFKDIQD